jgi:cell division protein FtsZ
MVMPGLINLDFADIRTVMAEMGKAMMGTGEAEGERRAIDAAEAAISNPLLEDVSMKGAKGVLINITGGLDMTLFEVDEAANRIREEVDSDANIIFGSTFDERLSGKMRISVVATGIDAEAVSQVRPTISLVSNRDSAAATAVREATAGMYAQPLLTQNAAQSPIDGAREPPHGAPSRVEHDSEPLPQAAEAAESAAMRVGSFTVPKPIDTGASRPVPLTQPAVPPAPAVKEPTSRPKGRVPSLIERVTGVGRARVAVAEPAPRPAAQPAKQVAQPRLTPLDPDDRPSLSKEEDLLDIPAFLRRQAN